MDNISKNINIIETAKEILLPPKEKIISILELFKLSEAKIKHSIEAAELAIEISKKYKEKQKKVVNLKVVEAGALLHDIGLSKTPDDCSPEHAAIGGDIIRKIGFPESVARCAETHEGFTHKEAERLKFPILPLKETYIPQTIEEKIVSASDSFLTLLKETSEVIDPWENPEKSLDLVYSYLRQICKNKLNKDLTKGDPFVQEFYERFLNRIIEFRDYVDPAFIRAL